MESGREIGELTAGMRSLTQAFAESREDERRRYDDLKLTLAKAIEMQAKQMELHAGRISKLELARAVLVGAIAAIGAAWAFFRVLFAYLSARNSGQ